MTIPDPWLKICGITRLTDALHAVSEGATAIGFIFWPGSPRCISAEAAGEISRAMPSNVMTVGVFMDEPVETVRRMAQTASLRMVQLHGAEPAAYVDQIDQPVIRSVTLENVAETADTWPADTMLLLDSTDPTRHSDGRAMVDWPRAAAAARARRIVLAGGLTPQNVEEAIRTVRPQGVDVASGVESTPGVKDFDKVTLFLANAHAAFSKR